MRRANTQDLRRIVDDESTIERSRGIDLASWDLLEHDADWTFGLAPHSIPRRSSGRVTNDNLKGPDHLQTEVFPAMRTGTVPKLRGRAKVPKCQKTSRRGLPYSSLPSGVIKSLSGTVARSVGVKTASISKESLEAIVNASDWFFEQLGEDLGMYAGHAGRKKIDERDISTIMKR